MTKSGVCKGSVKCRQSVGQLVGSLGVVLLAATGAQAGAWEEFEARCLVPMENVAAFDFSEMDVVPTEHELTVRWRSAEGIDLIVPRDDQIKQCGVESKDLEAQVLSSKVKSFLAEGLKSGRYELSTISWLPGAYLSTTWRETRMAIFFKSYGPYSEVSVSELNLES